MNNHITYVTIAYDLYKNKIIGQLNAWNRRGYGSSILFLAKHGDKYSTILRKNALEDNSEDIELIAFTSKKNAVHKIFKYLEENCNSVNDVIYIRRIGINILFANGYFKRANAKIIYEIPTYPIDSGTTLLRKFVLFIEQCYYKRYVYPYIIAEPVCLQKRLDIIPHKMILINNAVEVKTNDTMPRDDDNYSFIFFGNLQPWHGLNLFLEKIQNYKGSKSISVKIFSADTDCYNQLATKYRTCENIYFCGSSNLELVEKENTNKTIGIGGLAYNTRGADLDTSLKNKDYAAMGIPFIYVLPDLSFLNFEYAYPIKNVGEIDIDDILNWFSSIYSDSMYFEIKKFAREHLTYDKQIEELYKVVEK